MHQSDPVRIPDRAPIPVIPQVGRIHVPIKHLRHLLVRVCANAIASGIRQPNWTTLLQHVQQESCIGRVYAVVHVPDEFRPEVPLCNEADTRTAATNPMMVYLQIMVTALGRIGIGQVEELEVDAQTARVNARAINR